MAKRKRESAASVARRFWRAVRYHEDGVSFLDFPWRRWRAQCGGHAEFRLTRHAAMRAALAKVERED